MSEKMVRNGELFPAHPFCHQRKISSDRQPSSRGFTKSSRNSVISLQLNEGLAKYFLKPYGPPSGFVLPKTGSKSIRPTTQDFLFQPCYTFGTSKAKKS